MRVRLTTLPRLSCTVNGRELTALPNQRLRAGVLVYLAVERETTRERLLSMFWPETDPRRGRGALAQMLHEIGRDLGGTWFESSGDLICVSPEVEADAALLGDAVDRRAWREAVELYGGPFLDGLILVDTHGFEDWSARQRELIATLHVRARRELIRELREAGDLEGALAAAWRWVELEPLAEDAQARVIELLAVQGRRSDAERQLASFERLLRAEGRVPREETRALVRAAAATPPPGATRSSGPASAATNSAPLTPTSHAVPEADGGELAELRPGLEVRQRIGSGSVGTVHLAREPALNRLVAVKVLAHHLARDPTARRRFEIEAQSAGRINHPNVATVFRVGQLSDGVPYLVMPYVDGGTLEHRIAAAGALPFDEVRNLVAQIADALGAAHRLGIIHRDVRPANILYDRALHRALLSDFGLARVLDFGTAAAQRPTRPDERLGKPAYASPEQLRGDEVDERADIYSLGVVAYELLTARLPFDAKDAAEQIMATMRGDPRPLSDFRADVPRDLASVVERCMRPEPERRPFAADVVRMLG